MVPFDNLFFMFMLVALVIMMACILNARDASRQTAEDAVADSNVAQMAKANAESSARWYRARAEETMSTLEATVKRFEEATAHAVAMQTFIQDKGLSIQFLQHRAETRKLVEEAIQSARDTAMENTK